MSKSNLLASGLSLLLVALPRIATACPVCNANGEEESRVAFILTTIFLSALPVAMIGIGAWFVWRRIRSAEQAPRGAVSPTRFPHRSPAA